MCGEGVGQKCNKATEMPNGLERRVYRRERGGRWWGGVGENVSMAWGTERRQAKHAGMACPHPTNQRTNQNPSHVTRCHAGMTRLGEQPHKAC